MAFVFGGCGMRLNSSWLVSLFVMVTAAGIALPTADAGTVLNPGGDIRDIVADPTQEKAYVSLSTGELVVVDLTFETISHRIAVSGGADALAISPDGSKLFVALRDSKDIAVYHPGSSSLINIIDTSTYYTIGSMIATNTRLYASSISLMIVDTTTFTELYIGSEGGQYSDLFLSPDEQTLFISPLNAYDVSTDEPTQIADSCTGSAGSDFMSALFSSTGDEIYLSMGYPRALQILDWPGNGLLHAKKTIPLDGEQYWCTGMVELPSTSTLVLSFGSPWYGGGEKGLIFVRTSDWLPFRVEDAELYVWPRHFVRNPGGTKLAASGGRYLGYNDRIEIFTIDQIAGPTPNRGGIKFRPVDSIDPIPADEIHIHLPYPVQGSTEFFDVDDGIAATAATEPGTYNISFQSYNYNYDPVYETVDVLVDEWTDLGLIVMPRTGDLAEPSSFCAGRAVTTGEISAVTIHGRNFHPNAILTSTEPGIAIQSSTWVDWATFEATIAVEPGLDTNRRIRVFNIENPDGEDSSGYIFLLPGIDRVVSLGADTMSIAEASTTLNLQVNRTGPITGEVSVEYRTVDGTATAGSDFTDTSGTLTWPDGNSTPKTIAVPIAEDSVPEGDETFTVELFDPTGWALLGDHPETEVTIEDDDASTVRFSIAVASVDEPSGTVSLGVTRTGDLSAAGSVQWATADGSATDGEDYTSASGTLDWPSGDGGTKFIDVSILDDMIAEDDESFTVALSSPGGNAFLGEPAVSTVTIHSDDVTEIALSVASVTLNEGSGTATITALRNGVLNGAVTVDYATFDGTAVAGDDYTAVASTLNWADGDGAPKTINIPISDDGLIEIDETLVLTLSNPAGGATIVAPSSATLTIHDNDGTFLRFASGSFAAAETGGTAEITVGRIGGDIAGAVSVDFATADDLAEAGLDYVATSGTLDWADGETVSKTFSVTILDDSLLEGPENLILSLSNPTGNASLGQPSSSGLVISDDEGEEIPINTETNGPQTRPDVAMAPDGRSVVVWESYLQDGAGWGIFGQRFDADGSPAGSEFQVNSTTSGDQRYAAAAMAPGGAFTVVWRGFDVSGDGIRGRWFNADGAALGANFIVNTTTNGDQNEPAVAIDGSGDALVVWQTDHTGDLEIRGRSFNAAGSAIGNEFAVNTTISDDQQLPAVAGSAGGGFVVAWQGYGQDGPAEGIIARRFASDGSPLGAEVGVNEWTSGNQVSPDVGQADDGSFVVAWEDTTHQDGMGSSIRARRFSSAAASLGGDFQLNTHWMDDQMRPKVASDGAGTVTVTWESADQDGSDLGIFSRSIDSSGAFISREIQFNNHVAGIQYRPGVARSQTGGYWVTWASGGQDGSGDGIFGVFGAAPVIVNIFTDGFETGDTSGWSSSTP